MQGTLKKVNGSWVIENRYTEYDIPIYRIVQWKVTGVERRNAAAFAPEMEEGLNLEWCGSGSDSWQAYRQGGYLVLHSEHEGTTSEEPYPCPKVRRGVETRYNSGQWQKYLKSQGWQTV